MATHAAARTRRIPAARRTRISPTPPLDDPGAALPRGAGGRNRTADLPLTRRLLCQLSYAGPPTVYRRRSEPRHPGYTRPMRAQPVESPRRRAVAASRHSRPRRARAAPRSAGAARPPPRRPQVQARSGIVISRATGDVLWSKSPGPAAGPGVVHQDHDRAARPRALPRPQPVRARARPASRSSRRSPSGCALATASPSARRCAAMLVKSANDAAVTLAVAVDGSERAFVRRMNRRAAQLGLTHTHYVNSPRQGRRPGTTRRRATWRRWPRLRLARVPVFRAHRRHEEGGDHVAAVAPRDRDLTQPAPRLLVGRRHQDRAPRPRPARCSSAPGRRAGVAPHRRDHARADARPGGEGRGRAVQVGRRAVTAAPGPGGGAPRDSGPRAPRRFAALARRPAASPSPAAAASGKPAPAQRHRHGAAGGPGLDRHPHRARTRDACSGARTPTASWRRPPAPRS